MGRETDEAKVIIFYGLSNDEAVKAMKAVKNALETKDGIAFAMTTPTNVEWPLGELATHVWEEHKEMGKRWDTGQPGKKEPLDGGSSNES